MQQRWVCHAVFSLAVIGSFHATASAQAWVPDKGQLGVALDYNFSISDKVVTETTYDFEDAGTISHQVTLGLEYVPIEKLAVSASLPFMMLKYRNPGSFKHSIKASYDDGDYHSTLTDFRAGVRYQLLDDPLVITPHLAFTVPVADYETIGNTVAGRHLKQLHAGLSVGYVIGVATYIHAMYEFSLAEKYDATAETKKYSQNHSDASLTVGTKVLDYKLDLHLGANLRITHGGITFGDVDPTDVEGGMPRASTLSTNEQDYHDGILKEDIFLVGAGAGYDISPALSISLDIRYFVDQIKLSQNTQNASVVAVGLAWSPL
jgi:hypothetical protein